MRCIEHGNLIDDESVRLFVEKSAFLVPTLVTYEFLRSEGAAAGLPAESQDKVGVVLDAGLEALERAWRGGVNIAFGTDLLGSMQVHQSEEFRIRGQVQPAAEVLRSATVVAADLLGLIGRGRRGRPRCDRGPPGRRRQPARGRRRAGVAGARRCAP